MTRGGTAPRPLPAARRQGKRPAAATAASADGLAIFALT